MSEPITITRKSPRLAAVTATAPTRGRGYGRGGASIRGGASTVQRDGPASRGSRSRGVVFASLRMQDK